MFGKGEKQEQEIVFSGLGYTSSQARLTPFTTKVCKVGQ